MQYWDIIHLKLFYQITQDHCRMNAILDEIKFLSIEKSLQTKK